MGAELFSSTGSVWLAIIMLVPGIWLEFGYRIGIPREEKQDAAQLTLTYFALSAMWLPIYVAINNRPNQSNLVAALTVTLVV